MKLNGDYIEDMKQLEQCDCYSWGEDLLLAVDEEGYRFLVNQKTGKVRPISMPGHVICFSDKDIDFETINKFPLSHNACSRRMDYGDISRWDDCKNGLIALCWVLFPGEQYFADKGIAGMEGSHEVKVYCVMDDNLNVIRPFTIVHDVGALLEELRHK